MTKKTTGKVFLLTIMSIMILMLCTGCGKEKFTVGFDAEFPPYGYIDEETGDYIGFDLDLAKEVCERNGWSFKAQPIEWDSKDHELNSGTIDCIWNGFTINGRESEYTWSKAYVDNSQVVIVRADSDIYELKDLEGKVVEVQADSSALKALTGDDASAENIALTESFKELQEVSNYNTAFMDLEMEATHAICMDIGVASYQLERKKNAYRILDERISSEMYGIGFRLGDVELRDKVQATLDEMLEDGTFEEIAAKWGLSDCVCLGKEGTDEAYLQDYTQKEEKSYKDYFKDIMKHFPKGMAATLLIFVATLVFSIPWGLVVCAMRMSKSFILSLIAKVYISILRGTPLMLQLIVVFYGPYYMFGIKISSEYRLPAVIIGFSLNYAAYFAEIFRAGIQSIPNSQREAAMVLGYTKGQTFRRIVFPQMVKNVLPPVTNEVITLVKDTSLAFAISYVEVFTVAKQLAAAQTSVFALFVAGVFYYIFNFVVAFIMARIEKKLNYYS